MPDIRYVCLSDLHFGAENSLLSRLVQGTVSVDPTTASSVLDALVEALAAVIGANEDTSTKPTLILNGDILELALASDNVALMVFELFLDRIFPAGGKALFQPAIFYQPGNHDHHLWETARELQYANLLATLGPSDPLPIPWHSTRLYAEGDPRPVESEVLNQLARRRSTRQAVHFRMSYPNLGVASDDGRASIVFHHGHFSEPIYHLMSTLKSLIFPGRVQPQEVWDLEAENFAWIDFFWSTLGRSGDVGEDVGLVYDMLQSKQAIDRLARNLAGGIVDQIGQTGLLRHLHWLLRPVVNQVVEHLASAVAARERITPSAALSPKTAAGLGQYLAGPVLRQVANEAPSGDGRLPDQLRFVFGHTHKPFVASTLVAGLAQPVRLYNSGGWAVDTLQPEPLQGANAVLIDENLEVVCLRLYNQSSDRAAYRVRLDDGIPADQGEFYRRLSSVVRPDDEVWRQFSAAVADLVAERERALATIINNAGRPRQSATLAQMNTTAQPTDVPPTTRAQPAARSDNCN